MATLAARFACFVLLVAAASRMFVAERVIVNVKDEVSPGHESTAKQAQPHNGTDVAALARKFGGTSQTQREDERKEAKKAALVTFAKLLPGTWVTTNEKYSQRWYRIGGSDPLGFSLPIAVMKGKQASSVVIGDTVEYTGGETMDMGQKGKLNNGDRGIVVELMPKTAVASVQWEVKGSEVKWNVKISLVKVIKFDSVKAKALGTFTDKECLKVESCCEMQLDYEQKKWSMTRSAEASKSPESEGAQVQLVVKICIGDSLDTVEIQEERTKTNGNEATKKLYVKDVTTFKKFDESQK